MTNQLNDLQLIQSEFDKKYKDKPIQEYTKKDLIRMLDAMGDALMDLNHSVTHLHHQLQQAKEKPRIILQ